MYSNYKVMLLQRLYCKQNLQYGMYFAKHINYVTISASFSNLLILCKNAILSSLLDIKNAKKRECSNLHSLFLYMVEMAGVEPASASTTPMTLHV